MKIAVISDVHANLVALESVIRDIEDKRVDKLVFLGDLVMNGPNPKECFDLMSSLSPLAWIKGNTDEWFREIDKDFEPKTKREKHIFKLFKYASKYLNDSDIESLLMKPENKKLVIDGISILCSHGSHISSTDHIGIMTPTERMERITEELKTDILLCGHTHLSYYTSYNKKTIINVGSVGLSKDSDSRASYGIIDVSKDGFSYEVRRVRYDIDKTIKEAIECKFPSVENYINMLRSAE